MDTVNDRGSGTVEVVSAPPQREQTQRELEIDKEARRIAELAGRQRARVLHPSWWSDRLLSHAMVDAEFRARLFRFVDTFPALTDSADVESHLRAEFEGVDVPGWFGAGLGLAEHVPGGQSMSAAVARRGIDRMARQFVVGTDPAEVADAVGGLWLRHTAATVDLLGEHTHSEVEADRYASRLVALVDALAEAAPIWPRDELLDADDLGPVPRASVSVKVSALASAYTPLSAVEGLEQAERRLLPILRTATARNVYVWFDMERYETKNLTHRLFRRLLDERELAELHAGVVVQAYLRDSADDLTALAEWATGRQHPVGVRLVKGAYWDTETVDAQARGWPSPVFEHKAETDANYERLAGMLHAHHGTLRAAFATHNVRSLAAAVVEGRRAGIPDNGFEVQLLYGMAEPVHDAVRRRGLRLRVYAPMGELVPGMAYLVRRLLENTSNESFVRHFAEGEPLEESANPPDEAAIRRPWPGHPSPRTDVRTDPDHPGPYAPEPPLQWHRPELLERFSSAVDAEFFRAPWAPRQVPAKIAGHMVTTGRTIASVDPADADAVVAEAVACGQAEVDAAVDVATAAAPAWGRDRREERAALVFRVAQYLRRPSLSAGRHAGT